MSHLPLSWSTAAPPAKRGDLLPETIALYWLGQAGFLLESRSVRLLIDPYLSDSLAIKYRGTAHPHLRMRPPLLSPESLRDIDIVLVTHGHTDHMDPMTIGPVAAANPDCFFVVPSSCAELARSRGVPENRLMEANAFAPLEAAGVAIHPIPSAHEELAIDDHGRLLALGYVIELDGACFYHSGDCAPYAGLADNLSPFKIDLALLPVNGRDADRAASGIPGNFSLEEAVKLAESADFGASIGHHFGMFAFNSIDEAAAHRFLDIRNGPPVFLLAKEGHRYELDTSRRQLRLSNGTIRP
jgi:L-ascorbate metabolism protein UlaG (beta-lactamase superfamily)